jgi:hypothetical protein
MVLPLCQQLRDPLGIEISPFLPYIVLLFGPFHERVALVAEHHAVAPHPRHSRHLCSLVQLQLLLYHLPLLLVHTRSVDLAVCLYRIDREHPRLAGVYLSGSEMRRSFYLPEVVVEGLGVLLASVGIHSNLFIICISAVSR